jgi:predicted DsbA family dithiol-disulfide isomerase
MPGNENFHNPLRIDFVSDVACPWCAVGLLSLEQALERTRGEVQVDLHFQPFELNPQMPPEGEDAAEHLAKKYGLTEAELAGNQARIRQRGAELGFTFAARKRVHNTFDAHRLLHWAAIEGKQLLLKHALLRAYFTDGDNVSDHDTLLRIAGDVGLPTDRGRAILDSGEYASDVRIAEQFFLDNGIQGVPAVIIDQRHLISGGQPVEVFERALREIAEAKATKGTEVIEKP